MEKRRGTAGAERAVEPMSAPCLAFDLENEVGRLWEEQAARSGRNARTLVKQPDFRLVLTVLRAKERIQEHQANGRVSIHTIHGHVRLHVSQRGSADAIDLPAGHVLTLDRGIHHDVEALIDSAFLLTIAWPDAGAAQPATEPAA